MNLSQRMKNEDSLLFINKINYLFVLYTGIYGDMGQYVLYDMDLRITT